VLLGLVIFFLKFGGNLIWGISELIHYHRYVFLD